jgi:hypothetical protein
MGWPCFCAIGAGSGAARAGRLVAVPSLRDRVAAADRRLALASVGLSPARRAGGRADRAPAAAFWTIFEQVYMKQAFVDDLVFTNHRALWQAGRGSPDQPRLDPRPRRRGPGERRGREGRRGAARRCRRTRRRLKAGEQAMVVAALAAALSDVAGGKLATASPTPSRPTTSS